LCTACWKAHENFVPKEQHVQTKKETFTVEGYNSLFRHFLARLRRNKMFFESKINVGTFYQTADV